MRDDFVSDLQLFEPEAMLPAQFFAALRRKPAYRPEYLLAAAVLEDAIECFQKHLEARDTKMRRLYEDAAEWIASDDREWPFSYVNICELLDLHPDYLRDGLRSWAKNRQQARPRPNHAEGPEQIEYGRQPRGRFTGGCGRRERGAGEVFRTRLAFREGQTERGSEPRICL